MHSISLIRNAENMDDLKAIVMVDRMIPHLRHENIEEVINSYSRPEQIFLALSKIKYDERRLKGIDDQMDDIQNVSREVMRIIDTGPSRSNAKKLLGIMENYKKIGGDFREFIGGGNYRNTVGMFFEIQDRMFNLIQEYINENTINVLDSIDYDFDLSGDFEEDVKTARRNLKLFKVVKKRYNWFNRDKRELDNVDEVINRRLSYFSEVKRQRKKINSYGNEIRNYLKSIEDLSFDNISREQVSRLIESKKRFSCFRSELEDFRDDVYLGDSTGNLENLVIETDSAIDDKIDQLVFEARETIGSLDPNFDSTGSISEDLREIRKQMETYERVVTLYESLGRDIVEFDEKKDEILIHLKKYDSIYKRWKIILKDKSVFLEYLPTVKEHFEGEITQESVNWLVKIRDYLKKFNGIYQGYSDYSPLVFYDEIRSSIGEVKEIIERTEEGISKLIDQRIESNRTFIDLTEFQLREYNDRGYFRKIVGAFNLRQQFRVRRMSKDLELYKRELEFLRGFNN